MSADFFVTATTVEGDVAAVFLEGELDIVGSAALRDAVAAVFASGRAVIVLDLAKLTYIDSVGLGALLDARKLARQKGGDVRLRNINPIISRVLEIADIRSLFTIDMDGPPVAPV